MSKQMWLGLVTVMVVGVGLVGQFSPSETELAAQPFVMKNWMAKRYVGLAMGAISLVLFQAGLGVWPTIFWGTSLGWMLTVTFDLAGAFTMLVATVVLWSGIGARWPTLLVLGTIVLIGLVGRVNLDWNQLQVAAGKRLTDEFTTNNYQMGWPARVKAVAYNKYYFGLRQIYEPIVKTLDIEQLIAPGQQSATVTRSLWGGKDLPRVYFWALVLAIGGLSYWGRMAQQAKIGVLVLAGIGMWEGAVAILAGMAMTRLPMVAKWLVGVVIVSGIVSGYWHFLNDELVWRDNRPWAQEQMARLALEHGLGKPKTVTNLLGRSDLYYNWLAPTPDAQVTFRHFDLTAEQVVPGTVYIGLPGEFVGKNDRNTFNPTQLPPTLTLLNQTPIRDSVSFGNGDAIWVVEVN